MDRADPSCIQLALDALAGRHYHTLRSDPGRVVAPTLESIAKSDTNATDPHPRSGIATWNADGAMQALVREASTYGARFYAVEGRGLTARSDWVRTAQDTLASLALDTGGLSFLNGVQASYIADRVAADQADECHAAHPVSVVAQCFLVAAPRGFLRAIGDVGRRPLLLQAADLL